MPVTEWSYKEQDAAIRHIGPTAQDFHAAFGLGQDPLRIGTLDADGVALAGVRALEARTRSQSERIDALEQKLADALAALCALGGDCH
jgi:NifU-like protein involved in Fe-S cluster formation